MNPTLFSFILFNNNDNNSDINESFYYILSGYIRST